jgi:hypothetical protein
LPLLIFTDEQSKLYQRQVVETLAPLGVNAIFVEDLILEFLLHHSNHPSDAKNNYVAYEVGLLMRSMAAEDFELGHNSCPGGSKLGASCAAQIQFMA